MTIPVPNGALLKLIERDAKELSVYADLAEGIHGVTYFDPPRKPKVRIARGLFTESWRVHRLVAHSFDPIRWFPWSRRATCLERSESRNHR